MEQIPFVAFNFRGSHTLMPLQGQTRAEYEVQGGDATITIADASPGQEVEILFKVNNSYSPGNPHTYQVTILGVSGLLWTQQTSGVDGSSRVRFVKTYIGGWRQVGTQSAWA